MGEVQKQDSFEVPTSYYLKHPSAPHLRGQDEYRRLYQKSIDAPEAFWSSMATSLLKWETFFHRVHYGEFGTSNHNWFIGGKLNACYNCVDRHAFTDPGKVALIYERDTPEDEPQRITYGELLREVSKVSWVLRDMGVRKGDIVTIYMPNIPEAVVAMLACARIGAVHSVVFAGFSAPSLRDRIEDTRSKVILTVDEGVRGGKIIPMKRIVDDALSTYNKDPVKCLVLKKTGAPIPWSQENNNLWWHEECSQWPTYIEPEAMGSEDPLYMLYTSGSTGKPKGLMHTTAGYLLGCAVSGKYVLDIHPSDTMFCSGDVGWITGNSYLVYTPLVLGITTVVFDGTPSFPDYDRFWQIIDRNQVTHFYTAPTVLRMLKKARPNGTTKRMDRLRVIACIGEPLAPNVWEWCYEYVGKREAHVLDTYFQTETGCHAFAPFAGITPARPGSVGLPFFGVVPTLIDPVSETEIDGNDQKGVLVLKGPIPSLARTVWRDHDRYMKTYFEGYGGCYITGDGAYRDQDGYYQILGRVDDVVNISGHRLSTGEIESALLDHGSFSEVAVVGVHDDMTGQALNVFACLKNNVQSDKERLKSSAKQHIGNTIGRFAVPKQVFIVSDLPKTRSGKIMRRILRKILEGEEENLGDISTLLRPEVVKDVIDELRKQIGPTGAGVTSGQNGVVVSNLSKTDVPYHFRPYNLSPLDNILPPCHMFMFLTFDSYSSEGIDALKTGVTRLSAHFPFLTGVVVPSSQPAGKQNVFEVQPASSSFMEKYPMLQVAYNPELDFLSPDDFIDQNYLPIQFLTPPTEPMPLVRFKANLTNRKIILSVAYFHRALDSTGVSVVLKTLAALCKDPNASPDLLPTSTRAEETSRQHLIDSAAKYPVPFNWTSVPLSPDVSPPDSVGKVPISRRFKLDAKKITLLKDACNAAITRLPPDANGVKPSPLTSNDIITALVGLCGNRARLDTVLESNPPPKVIIAANVRKPSLLPATYVGNALAAVEAPYDAAVLPEGTGLHGLSAELAREDLSRLLNIAFSLRIEVNALTKSYMQGILCNIANTPDMCSFFPAYGGSIIVSSLRWMDFYLDFGPLGKVQEYDIPETKVKGVCWVLPSRDLRGDVGSQPFELRFVLERAAMEQLQNDSLFRWMRVDV
ncbi:acetyl-CoA synthetase [Arachnomyces sp. PD_36]|nr:acetyl-CoA synthetase [Arachnomyces sp. PD_36]